MLSSYTDDDEVDLSKFVESCSGGRNVEDSLRKGSKHRLDEDTFVAEVLLAE